MLMQCRCGATLHGFNVVHTDDVHDLNTHASLYLSLIKMRWILLMNYIAILYCRQVDGTVCPAILVPRLHMHVDLG